jgi:hypothetical protein
MLPVMRFGLGDLDSIHCLNLCRTSWGSSRLEGRPGSESRQEEPMKEIPQCC